MSVNFEATITEADFKRPLLEPTEESFIRELHREPDLAVEGLASSLLGCLAGLFGGR